MKKAIVHIGLPKTGTTSIQEALYATRERLLETSGIFYPSISPNLNNVLCTSFFDDPRKHIEAAMEGLDTLEKARAKSQTLLQQLQDDLKSANWETVVLSAEGLSNLNRHELRNMADWLSGYVDDWRIFFWVRHPLSYASSVSQELVKGGMTFAQMLSNGASLPSFEGRVNNIAHAFGREKIELHVFEEAMLSSGGVVGAFCRAIGLPDDFALEIALQAGHKNSSMSHVATLILEAMNRHHPLIIDGTPNPRRSRYEQDFVSRVTSAPFYLPAEVSMVLREQCRPDVAWLNQAFERSLYLDIFEDGPLNGPIDTLPPDTVESLASVIGDLLAMLQK